MKNIKKYVINNVFFVFVSLFAFVTVEAMRISPEGQAQVKKEFVRQKELRQAKQVEEERRIRAEARQDFVEGVKSLPYFKEFQQKLQFNEISKAWFQGPNEKWMNEIVILAFEVLEIYKNPAKYAYNFDRLHSYLLSEICNAIKAYDETCYLRISDISLVCKDVSDKLNNLIAFSKSPTKIQPTIENKYISAHIFVPHSALEGEALYNQLLEARKQRKPMIEED